jgi:integrase
MSAFTDGREGRPLPKKINLNKTAVENLPFTDGNYENVMDARLTGFGVRVGQATKTYFIYTRVKGRVNAAGRPLEIRETLGRHGVKNFEDAKAEAKQILEDAANGITPDDRKREKELQLQVAKDTDVTLEEAFEKYLAWNKRIKNSTRDNYRTHIDSYLADWKDKPVREITSEDVLERHAFLSKKIVLPAAPPYKRKPRKRVADPEEPRPKKVRQLTNGPGVANATMRILRAVINYLRTNKKYAETIKTNPVHLRKAWNRLKKREKMVTLDRLPAWFQAVNASEHPTVKDLLLFLLFTGTRSKTEAFKLKWPDIDWAGEAIYFSDTKNSTTLRLPMGKYLFKILKARNNRRPTIVATETEGAERPAHLDYVFPSPKAEEGHVTNIRKELDKISKRAGFKISPHDLRRTFLTYADDNLGISFLTIKALVNHESNDGTTSGNEDVTAGYIQVQMPQRRQAIQKIEDYILKMAKVPKAPLAAANETDRGQCDGSGI